MGFLRPQRRTQGMARLFHAQGAPVGRGGTTGQEIECMSDQFDSSGNKTLSASAPQNTQQWQYPPGQFDTVMDKPLESVLGGASIQTLPVETGRNALQPQASTGVSTDSIAKQYCMEVLGNVRKINSHPDLYNPQAFSTILTTMGFLSSLCCSQDDGEGDKAKFICFVRRWMPEKYHSIAKDLYKVVRCGLVHSASIVSTSGQTAFAMTHDAANFTHLETAMVVGGEKTVLVASSLCDDIEEAINKMFNDSGTQKTIEENFSKKPPINAYSMTPAS